MSHVEPGWLPEYMNDELDYGQVGDMVIVANDPGSDDGRERRFTRLIDSQGEVLGELDVDIDEPSVVAADPTHSSFVIGDDRQLIGFQITAAD